MTEGPPLTREILSRRTKSWQFQELEATTAMCMGVHTRHRKFCVFIVTDSPRMSNAEGLLFLAPNGGEGACGEYYKLEGLH